MDDITYLQKWYKITRVFLDKRDYYEVCNIIQTDNRKELKKTKI